MVRGHSDLAEGSVDFSAQVEAKGENRWRKNQDREEKNDEKSLFLLSVKRTDGEV